MDVKVINDILTRHISEYDQSLTGINHCLAAYEPKCMELIECVANSSSSSEADKYFDELYEIQRKLSELLFARNIDVGKKLTSLTKEFDRLHDPYIRDYWLERFRMGERWPE